MAEQKQEQPLESPKPTLLETLQQRYQQAISELSQAAVSEREHRETADRMYEQYMVAQGKVEELTILIRLVKEGEGADVP